jgi:hypothetical protein
MPKTTADGKLKAFISYSRAELAFADELVAGLEVMGFDLTGVNCVAWDNVGSTKVWSLDFHRVRRIIAHDYRSVSIASHPPPQFGATAAPLGHLMWGRTCCSELV